MAPWALALWLAAAADPGPDRAPPPPGVDLHGRLYLDQRCSRAGVPAVAFDHWRHRAMYTCRACHVDLGFALGAGETPISAETNDAGTHCGACHDGKTVRGRTVVFRACSGWPHPDAKRGCTRCHVGTRDDPRRAYDELARTLPATSEGEIDWIGALVRGVITPRDGVEGVTAERPAMRMDRDLTLRAAGTWLQNVTFSHRRHAIATGCELCHPEIFPVTERGTVKFGMGDLQAGRYCGVCHRNVAFSVAECRRCHVQQRQLR